MIINHDLKFIFIHIGKTGGTSIEATLCEQTGMDFPLTHTNPAIAPDNCKHYTTRQLRPILGEACWNGYFKFAFVRHPFDWLVSAWSMHSQEKRDLPWLNREWRSFATFQDFLAALPDHPSLLVGEYISQSAQICDERGRIDVDFIGRFEHLQADFDSVCRRLGLPPAPLAHRAGSQHQPCESYYNDEARETVYRILEEDFIRFGYGSGLTRRGPLVRAAGGRPEGGVFRTFVSGGMTASPRPPVSGGSVIPPADGRKKIVVVGYPLGRTGSSALMGLLQLAGCNSGKNVFMEPSPMNPRGFFELPAQQQFLERIYTGIYPQLAPPPPPDLLAEIGRRHAGEYRDLLASEFDERYPAAVKSQWWLTLPFLEQLSGEFDIRLLSLERNLEDQVSSFQRVWQATDHPVRKHASREYLRDFILCWREFTAGILAATPLPVLPVTFDELMRQPASQMEEICRFTGLPLPAPDLLKAWLDPSLVNRPALGLPESGREKTTGFPATGKPGAPAAVWPADGLPGAGKDSGTAIRLNLGCGPKRLDGYVNIDIIPSAAANLVADITRLPFAAGTCDEIRMDAVFEHLYRHDRTPALRSWRELLKPGGRLVLNWIPDFDAILDAYRTRQPGILHPRFDLWEVWRFTHGQYTAADIPYQVHKDVFTVESVRQELQEAGFEVLTVENVHYEQEPVSVNIRAEACKPDPAAVSAPDGASAAAPGRVKNLSVVVNTLDAAGYLDGCLASVAPVAGEIVLVDMYSGDRTVEIARRYGARIFYHERLDYVEPARNFAISKADGEWILILDSDERLTPLLQQELPALLENPGGIDVFLIPRNNQIVGRWLLGSGWGLEYECQPRLFRKGSLEWTDKIHQRPVIRGQEGYLPLPPEAAIDHLNYRDLDQFISRLNRYTGIEARGLAGAGQTWSLAEMCRRTAEEFRFRYDPGRDGMHSLILAAGMAFYRFLAWAKLWELQGFPQEALPAGADQFLAWLARPEQTTGEWRMLDEAIRACGQREPSFTDENRQRSLQELLRQMDEATARGDLKGALAIVHQALALAPRDPGLSVTRGNLLFSTGELEQAGQVFYRATRIAPGYWPAHAYLAAQLFETGRYAEAEPAIRQALELDPGNTGALDLLGRILMKLNRFREVIPVQEELLRHFPDEVNIYLTLGLCHFQAGDRAASRRMYRRALELDPGNEQARSSLVLLDQQQANQALG